MMKVLWGDKRRLDQAMDEAEAVKADVVRLKEDTTRIIAAVDELSAVGRDKPSLTKGIETTKRMAKVLNAGSLQ